MQEGDALLTVPPTALVNEKHSLEPSEGNSESALRALRRALDRPAAGIAPFPPGVTLDPATLPLNRPPPLPAILQHCVLPPETSTRNSTEPTASTTFPARPATGAKSPAPWASVVYGTGTDVGSATILHPTVAASLSLRLSEGESRAEEATVSGIPELSALQDPRDEAERPALGPRLAHMAGNAMAPAGVRHHAMQGGVLGGDEGAGEQLEPEPSSGTKARKAQSRHTGLRVSTRHAAAKVSKPPAIPKPERRRTRPGKSKAEPPVDEEVRSESHERPRRRARAAATAEQQPMQDSKAARQQARLRARKEKNRLNQALFRQKQKDTIEEYRQRVELLMGEAQAQAQRRTSALQVASTLSSRLAIWQQAQLINRLTSTGLKFERPETVDVLTSVSMRLLSCMRNAQVIVPKTVVSGIIEAQFMQLFQDFVSEVANSLVDQALPDHHSSAHLRMVQLIDLNRELAHKVWLSTGWIRTLVGRLVQGYVAEEDNGPLPQERWRRLLDAVGFTPTQRRAIVNKWRAYGRAHAAIMARRHYLVALLRDSSPTPDPGDAAVGIGPGELIPRSSAAWSSADYLQVQEVTQALRDNVDEETVTYANFMSSTYVEHVTHLQEAKMTVELFPWRCDVVCMCSAMAAQLDEQDALAFPRALGPGASGSSAAAATMTLISGS